MSEVNADGVLITPLETLLRQVPGLPQARLPEGTDGMEEDWSEQAFSGNGEAAGTMGGAPPQAGGEADNRFSIAEAGRKTQSNEGKEEGKNGKYQCTGNGGNERSGGGH